MVIWGQNYFNGNYPSKYRPFPSQVLALVFTFSVNSLIFLNKVRLIGVNHTQMSQPLFLNSLVIHQNLSHSPSNLKQAFQQAFSVVHQMNEYFLIPIFQVQIVNSCVIFRISRLKKVKKIFVFNLKDTEKKPQERKAFKTEYCIISPQHRGGGHHHKGQKPFRLYVCVFQLGNKKLLALKDLKAAASTTTQHPTLECDPFYSPGVVLKNTQRKLSIYTRYSHSLLYAFISVDLH